jgi:hypothetical protein
MLKMNELYNAPDFKMILLCAHGMANIDNYIFLNELINPKIGRVVFSTQTFAHISLFHSSEVNRFHLEHLRKLPHIDVYRKARLLRDDKNVEDVVIAAHIGTSLHTKENISLIFHKINLTASEKYNLLKELLNKANYGYYDGLYESMLGFFAAKGAFFRRNLAAIGPIERDDIYPLVCTILSINCKIAITPRVHQLLYSNAAILNSSILTFYSFVYFGFYTIVK